METLTGQAVPGAQGAQPDPGVTPAGVVTSPVTFQPAVPAPIESADDGALPLEPDASVGRGPVLGKPSKPVAEKTELTDQRTEHTRTFVNPDGTFTTEASEGRMNFQAPDGSWMPLDLDLKPVTDGPFDLAVTASDRAVKFGSSDAAAGLASISADGHSLSIRAIGYGAADARAAGDNKVAFAGSGKDGSVFAVPTDTGFEFGVTLGSADVSPTYLFAVDAGDLQVELAPDGQTMLLVSGTEDRPSVVGGIDAPALVSPDGSPELDAKVVSVALHRPGDITPDVPADVLAGLSKTEVLVSYSIDPAWLHAPDREFPVTLDPTACIGAGASGCTINSSNGTYDEFIFSYNPNYHTIGWTVMRVGYDNRNEPTSPQPYDIMRSLLYFPDVTLPDGAQVTSATTKVRVSNVYGSPGSKYLAFYRVNVPWGTNSVDWNDIIPSGYDSTSQSPAFQIPSGVAAGNTLTIDMSGIARQWYTRRGEDWKFDTGILLRMCTTTNCSATETSTIGELTLNKYTDSTSSYRPLLTITYVIPALQIDFDTALGANYAPSAMTAGADATLPVTVKNVTNTFGSPVTSYTFDKCTSTSDADCYQLGYRWIDGDGAVVHCSTGSCTVDFSSDVTPGSTSSLMGLVVRAPAVGQYTLRLDLVHRLGGSSGTYVWSSDWASPSLYYSRDKRIAGFDSSRWTGTSAIERDEFGITVTTGGGTAVGDLQTVTTGDGSSFGINLATKNLHYDGDTRLGFTDLGASLGLTYGYDRANTADCTGVLAACGWFTNWDERVTAGAYDSPTFTYQDPGGNRFLGSSDPTGQLVSGARAQLSRPRVTWFDENPLYSGSAATVVTAGSAGIPTYSGPSVIRTSSNTSTGIGQPPYVNLNVYPLVSFAARSTAASGTGIDFKIRNVTTGYEFWFIYELGTSFTTSFDHVNLGGTLLNTWDAVVRRNLYDDIYGLHGGSNDQYEVIAFQTTTNGLAQGGYTYIDAVRFQGRDDTETGSQPFFFKDNNPIWTANGGNASLITSDKAVGTSSIKVTSAALTSSPYCNSQSGATCWTSWRLAWGFRYATWYWKKVGGTSIAMSVDMQDDRTNTIKTLTYYAGALPSGVASTCGAAGNQPCAIRIDTALPGTWTRVTRNILADAQQVLGFYYDSPGSSDPAAPPSQGPTPDWLHWTATRISGVDGQYGLFDDLRVQSAPDLDANNPAGSQYTAIAGDDYAATYSDGTVHRFNALGLLSRIVDRDGNAITLDWSFDTTAAAGAGQAADTLTVIHAPTDGTTNSTYTYQREIDVTHTTNSPGTGLNKTTFTEALGSTGTGGSTPTGRTASFAVGSASSAGSPQYGIGDLVYVSPARKTSTTCNGTRPTGCVEFDYNTTSSHSLREVRDPRWDGTTGSSPNHMGFGVLFTGVDAYAITDLRTGAADLYIPSFNRTAGTYRVPIYQTATNRSSSYAQDVLLSPDGRVLTEYIAKACTGQCSTSSGTWPAAASSPDRRTVNEFDGLARVNKVTQYRTVNSNPIVNRQASQAGIQVDNFIDVLSGNEILWSQTPEQYVAWLAASSPVQSDGVTPTAPYISSYAYDEHHRVTDTITPIANPVGTGPSQDLHTTYDAEGHPTSTDDNTWLRNPGFENGLNGGWSTYTGTATLETSAPHSGTNAVKLNHATVQTDHYQGVQLLPGQTFRLQGWAKAGSGTTARIAVIYQRVVGGSFYTIGTLSTSSTSWTQLAGDFTIPTDGTGIIHVDLLAYANTTSWYDDLSLFTQYQTRAYDGFGRLSDTYSLDSASATGTLRTNLAYSATSVHPAIVPTTVIGNYGNGSPGPNPDDDVTTTSTVDRWGRTLAATDPDGVTTTTAFASNQTDVASVTDGNGNATTYGYDNVGNRTSVTLPLGEVTTTTYDLLNMPLQTTLADGTKSLNIYNSYGERTSSIANYEDGTTGNGDGTDDVITTYALDEYGQVTSAVADPSGIGATSDATYDLAGDVVRSTLHTGQRIANPGFETSATLATAWYHNAGYSLSAAVKHGGARALLMVVPNPSVITYAQTYRLAAGGGNRYAVSAWFAGKATNSASAGAVVKVRFFKADGTSTDSQVGTITKGTSTTWSQVSGTVTAPIGTVELFVFASLNATTIGDTLYLDDASLDELRDTTTYFDSVGHPAGSQGPIEPGATSPACPGAPSEYCNQVAAIDVNGRTTSVTDAYAKVTRVLYDLAGHPVRSTANYVDDVFSAGAPDTDLATVTAYDIRGRVAAVTDVAGRTTTTGYDDLDRPVLVTNAEGGFTKTVYTYGGRVDRDSLVAASGTTDANLTWTKHVYDFAAYPGTGVGREVRSLSHYDTGGYYRFGMWAFEDLSTQGWSTAASGTFTTTAAGSIGFDTDYHTTAPYSGRGRLRLTTHATNANDGMWLDLSGQTFQSGRTYHLHADLIGWNGYSLTAKLGVDGASNNASTVINLNGSWQALDLDWTPSATVSTNVHFALVKTSAGAISAYLDNLVIYDTVVPDRNLPSDTAFDADGRVIASVLPPGDPATERPLVTLTTYDLAGRPLAVGVNGRVVYSHVIESDANLVSYWPLDETTGTSAADKKGSNTGTYTGGFDPDVAGGVDDNRTGVHLNGTTGQVSVPDSASLDVSSGVTVEYWASSDVLLDSTKAANTWYGGVYKSGAYGLGWTTWIANGGWRFQIVSGGVTYTANSAAMTVEPHRWYHVVGTYDGADLKLYVDGTLVATTTIGANTITNSTSALTIGQMSGFWAGSIDDVALYSAGLSATTVTSHWQSGVDPTAANRLTTRTFYDHLGRATDVIDPRGIRTHYAYDRLGRLTMTIANYRDGTPSATSADDDAVSTFGYDALGELVTYCSAVQTYPGPPNLACDATDRATPVGWHTDYDPAGHAVADIAPDNATATDLLATYTQYDAGGRVTTTCSIAYGTNSSCTGSPARHTDLTYDGVGRVLTSKLYEGAGTGTLRVQSIQTYNADGTVATATDGTDSLTFTYDAMGRPDQTKRSSTVLTDYGWNATGTLASRLDGGLGTSNFTYDWANRELTATSPAYTGSTTFSWRLDGLLGTRGLPGDGTLGTYTYDAAKRVTAYAKAGTTSLSLSQSYDRAGNVTAEGRTFAGVTGAAGTGSSTFTYDGLSRVTGASLAGGTSQSYTYDRDGNRLTKTDAGVTTTYTYDRADELISQTIAGVPATFTYNAYGDLTQAPDATNALTTYAYDQAGRLTSLTPPAASATTYTYDAAGRIATRVTPAGTDTYSYIGTSETVWQVANAGLTVTSAIDAAGVRTAVTPGGTVGLTLPDLHGSIAAELTQNATGVLSALRYDPYGLVTASYDSGGGFTNPWRYGGRLDLSPDAANPRYDVSARDYLPTAGVFASLDTYAGQASDPRSMNRFLYAEANPATLIDPSGHAGCSGTGKHASAGKSCTSTAINKNLVKAKSNNPAVQAADAAIETDYINHQHAGGAVAPTKAPTFDPHQWDGTCLVAGSALFGEPACVSQYFYNDGSHDDPFWRGFSDSLLFSGAGALAAGVCIVVTAGACTPFAIAAGVGLTTYAIRDAYTRHGFDLGHDHLGGTEPWSEYERGGWFGAGAFVLVAGGYGVAARGSSSAALSVQGSEYFEPGPFAGDWIPATGPRVTPAQSQAIQEIGSATGCHTCGSRTAGPPGSVFRFDHQPVTGLSTPGAPAKGYPQCVTCSARQGAYVLQYLRGGGPIPYEPSLAAPWAPAPQLWYGPPIGLVASTWSN